jgi:hypothetical protein
MRHRLVIAAALLLALAGCSDDSPEPKASASTTQATASPTLTGPVAPVLPEAAKAKTQAGAKAFVRYWFEAITFAMKTGETSEVDEVAHADCDSCTNLTRSIRSIYDEGQRNVGGGWNVLLINPAPGNSSPNYRFVVRVDQPVQRLVDSDGRTLNRDKKQSFIFLAGATWDEGWKLYGLQKVK